MFRDFFKSSEKTPPTPEELAQAEFRADHAAFFRAIAKSDVPAIDATVKKYGRECLNWEKSDHTPIHFALRKNKLPPFIALLDYGADTQNKVKTDGDYCTLYLSVLEHALHRGRDDFVYALLQRRDDTRHRQFPYMSDTLKDMIKRAEKIRAAHLAGLPKPPPANEPPIQKSMPPAVQNDVPFLKLRISKLEKALGAALARIEKLENPDNDNTLPLDKPHYPLNGSTPKPKK